MRLPIVPLLPVVLRRHFLTALGGAALGTSLMPSLAHAASVDLSAPLRVRLFAGGAVAQLFAGGYSIDLAGDVTHEGRTWQLGDQTLALSGDPYLEVSATTAGETITRRYPGAVYVRLRAGTLLAINQVDVETYVASVMAAEVSPGWAQESLRAQAIAVRTYAARARLDRRARDYDLNDDTSAQVYRGIAAVAPSLVTAALDTAGNVVMAGSAPAEIFYSSSCGGHTASSQELSGLTAPPYLQGVSDLDANGRAFCAGAPYFRWKNVVSAASLARIVELPTDQLGDISIAERWPDGRVKRVSAAGRTATVSLDGHTFYSRALSELGYKVIPSALFDITRTGDAYAFIGHGVGHGVGMCQWGARGRAEAGMSAAQILQAYLPGTAISRL